MLCIILILKSLNKRDNNSLHLFTFIYVAYLVNVFCVSEKEEK